MEAPAPALALELEPAQRTAAKVAGVIYLAAMASSMFAELYALRGQVTPDAAETARNILAAEPLFRLGVVTHLVTFASDAALAAALYVVLSPVNKGLAMLGAFWRLVDCAVLSVATLAQLVALRIVSGPGYLSALEPAQARSLARLLLAVRGDGMSVGWVFLGLGSAVFSYLWFKSRYIPRLLAGWGVFASLLLAAGPLLAMLAPGAMKAIGPGYMVPMFFYEVPLGLCLVFRGIRAPTA
jgi:hypothetical protein